MVVCGDDGLARRLADELREVYQRPVTLVIPADDPPDATARWAGRRRGYARVGQRLLGRGPATAEPPRPAARTGTGELRLVEAAEPTEETLSHAGVTGATALALVYEDDETNVRAALAARRLNPRLRLVIRLYNRKLGQHLEELLDQAAAVAVPGIDLAELDSSTTVLSDADTVAPALVATAIAGTSKVIQADGLLLRAAERPPPARGESPDPGLCTLALLSATAGDPAGTEGSDSSGANGPQLLPDDREVTLATGRATVVLEAVTHDGPGHTAPWLRTAALPVGSLFSQRLRWTLAVLLTALAGLTLVSWLTTGGHPLHAAYATLLDLFAINEPALEGPAERQVLQLLAALVGLLLLPVLVAAFLEAFGAFRTASALRRPPRGLTGHVVLLGLGKIGTRVLAQLRELDIPVVCVESDPEARGIPLARRLRIPVTLGDVTEEGVLEAARIHRARALLALTSSDTTNLEATLYARSVHSGVRVALRLYDDDFATAVHRTLRAAHPDALTRSRSVTHLAAPAFAGAMMGRRILGAIPVERRVLLFALVEVAGHPRLEGRTVAQSFRPGAWRVIALDAADTSAPAGPGGRRPGPATASDGSPGAGLVWELSPGHVLRAGERVVVAATRQGLAGLLGDSAGPVDPDGGHPDRRTRDSRVRSARNRAPRRAPRPPGGHGGRPLPGR
ncbi:NAD-binding protein [Streptomyces sp. NPDC000594]|uniref:NAD-binding protein n=1 Tax=Streptomyces sp. NPDC000594 TaxID=3154261 RepID=UPI0033176F65